MKWLCLLAMSALAAPALAPACAPIMPDRYTQFRIAYENVVISWDPVTRTENFIRQADFETPAQFFGFLVPTPTKPKLGEVDDSLFDSLDQITQPEVRYERLTGIKFLTSWSIPSEDTAGATLAAPGEATESAPTVHVLDKAKVGDYDVTVLRADDMASLTAWLKTNKFVTRPALENWLQTYVKNGWILSAFKFHKRETDYLSPFESKAVRMTFQSEQPFFPYREPEDMRLDSRGTRSLRAFLLTPQRMNGMIGHDAKKWPGEVRWVRSLRPEEKSDLSSLLGNDVLPTGPTVKLTMFADNSFPRPGTDELYFTVSSAQEDRVPPPIIHIIDGRRQIPMMLWLPALALGLFLVVRIGMAIAKAARKRA